MIGTDIFPTVGEALSQGDYAASPDGRSFLPLLQGEPARRRPLYWTAPYGGPEGPASAVREGNFKLYRDDATDSLTYFNLGALPDESLRMAMPPREVDLLKWVDGRK